MKKFLICLMLSFIIWYQVPKNGYQQPIQQSIKVERIYMNEQGVFATYDENKDPVQDFDIFFPHYTIIKIEEIKSF